MTNDDATTDEAVKAVDDARQPLLKRVGASVDATTKMNHRLMRNPKFRALLVESVRRMRCDAMRQASVNMTARRLTSDFE
jgi:choline dehydrogenase-like flavoprotein